MNIIIIDDEPKIRKGIGIMLERHPGWHVVGSFSDADSAISYLEKQIPDVIITDIIIPGFTGLELIEWVRKKDKEVPIIILSGYGRFDYAKRAIDLGVKKYLTKPTPPDELTQALEQIEADGIHRHSENTTQIKLNESGNLLVHRAIEYMGLHYREKVSLSDIAAALYISPNYLSDLFKKQTGIKLFDYLLNVRMEKSKEYLQDVHYTVGDVANLVGFSDPRYFSSVFRKKFAQTPQEFRNTSDPGKSKK